MEVKEWLNNNELSCNIFNKKYRDNEESFDEFLDRVSHGYEPVKKLIEEKKFMFGGRILASRDVKNRKVTYSNCYVIAPPEDNLVWLALSILALDLLIILINSKNPPGLSVIVALNE